MPANLITTGRIGVQQSAYSPHLALWMKMDEGAGFDFKDSSQYHWDHSVLNALPWRPATTWLINRLAAPTIANGFVYDPTVFGSSGTGITSATAGLEPNWPIIAGNTVTENAGVNSILWTARLPATDYWSGGGTGILATSAQFSGTVALNRNALFPRQRYHPLLRDYLMPSLLNGLSYQSSTISAATADNSINDVNAAGWGALAPVAGDWIMPTPGGAGLSGFTVDTANNNVMRIATVAATKLTFDRGGPNAVAATGDNIILRKILPPASLVVAFNINTSLSTNGLSLFEAIYHHGIVGVAGGGFSIRLGISRICTYTTVDNVNVASSITLGGSLTSATNFHLCFVINRDLATPTCALYVNGGFNTQTNLTKRNMCNLLAAPTTGPSLGIAVPLGIPPNGRTLLGDLQVYVGRGVPAGLQGATPSLVAKIESGIPLSPTDWP